MKSQCPPQWLGGAGGLKTGCQSASFVADQESWMMVKNRELNYPVCDYPKGQNKNYDAN